MILKFNMSHFKFIETSTITSMDGCIVSKDIHNIISQGFVFGAILEECETENRKQIALLEKYAQRLDETNTYIANFNQRKEEYLKKKQDEHNQLVAIETEKLEEFKKNNDKEIEENKKIIDDATKICDDILLKIKNNDNQNNKKELNDKLIEMRNEICLAKKIIRELKKKCENFTAVCQKICDKRPDIYDHNFEDYGEYKKMVNEHDKIVNEINAKEEPLWKDILFFKVISKQDTNLICQVDELFYRRTKSELKIGDTVSIDKKYVSFVITDKYITKKFCISSYQTKNVTNWKGDLYSDANLVKKLILPNWTVRVQLKDKRRNTICVWYMKILKREGDILYGQSLEMEKNQKEDYNYENNFKCNCIYKFHLNAIVQLPYWKNQEKYETQFRMTTKMSLETQNNDYIEV